MPKGFQKGGKIDAKTHQKTMPKQVSTNIRENVKFNVFSKTIQNRASLTSTPCGSSSPREIQKDGLNER